MINLLLVAIVVVAGGYVVSAYLHPFRPCGKCNGSGVHRGAIYRRATRRCTGCRGRGRFRRIGAPSDGRAFGERRR